MEDSDLFYDDFDTHDYDSSSEYRDAYEESMELANKYADKYRNLMDDYEELERYNSNLESENQKLKSIIEELKYYSKIGVDYILDYVNKKEIIEDDIKVSKDKKLKVPKITYNKNINEEESETSNNLGEGIFGSLFYGIIKIFESF